MTAQPSINGVAIGCGIAAVIVAGLFIIGSAALYYYGFVQRGGVYDELRLQLAEGQLNQLVPYIEMYRTQTGSLPDSLADVQTYIPDNTPVFVHDVSAPPLGEQRLYYYERLDAERYILLGVGPDSKPFTEDDVLPIEWLGVAPGLESTR